MSTRVTGRVDAPGMRRFLRRVRPLVWKERFDIGGSMLALLAEVAQERTSVAAG